MNINAISSNQNPNFNGKLLTRGTWTSELKNTFMNNEALNNLAKNSRYDIMGVMTSYKASKDDIYHDAGELLYKLALVAVKEKPTFKEKVKNFFSLTQDLKKKVITENYHRETSMLDIMTNRLNSDKCNKIKLDLNI